MSCPCPPALKHKVELQRETSADDGAGGSVVTWTHVAYLWCELRQLSGKEKYARDKVEGQSTHKLTMRYFSDITQSDKIIFRGIDYNIDAIDNVNMDNLWHVITLRAGVAQ